jgi:hypothetical protein
MLKIPLKTAKECSGTRDSLHYESDQDALDRLYAGLECDEMNLVE